MAYPKPLSEKSLNKMYTEAKLTEEKKDFLHCFFKAASNLYGTVLVAELWEGYKQYSQIHTAPKLLKKDIVAFSAIARREKLPYYIFEIDEVFSEEPRKEALRILANRKLIGMGYGKFYHLVQLRELQADHPLYMGEDFLDFAEPKITKEEQRLRDFLRRLRITAKEYVDDRGRRYPCEHRGKRLGEIDFLNRNEQFELDYLSGKIKEGPKNNPKKVAEILADLKGPESDKLVRQLMRRLSTGQLIQTGAIKYITDELAEVGVELNKKQVEKLLELITDVNNNTHLWCNSGWTPCDLFEMRSREGYRPKGIEFGPGMEKAFAEGDINRDELIKIIEGCGIKVLK